MKHIFKITILLLFFISQSTVGIAQSKCFDELLVGSEWTGEWETSFGTLKLKQEGSKVTGTYRNLGEIEAYYDSLTGTLEGTFMNKGQKGSFEFKFTSCDSFKGKWGWGESLNKGAWDGKRKVIQQNQHRIILILNGLRAIEGGDGKGNPDDYSLDFAPNLFINNRKINQKNKIFNFRKKEHLKHKSDNVLFSSKSGQLHIEPDYPPTKKDRSTNSKKYASIGNSGQFHIDVDDYKNSALTMNIDVSVLENTKSNFLTSPNGPYWLVKKFKVPVNIKLVLDYLTGAKTANEVERYLSEFLPNKGSQIFELGTENGKRKAKGYIVVQKKEDGRTYKAGIAYTIELVE